MYTIFHIGQALAQNIETLLVTRFISGFFACAPLTNSGGVIADIWDPETRGLAVSLFTASVFMGPVLGPIVSGLYVIDFVFMSTLSLLTSPFSIASPRVQSPGDGSSGL